MSPAVVFASVRGGTAEGGTGDEASDVRREGGVMGTLTVVLVVLAALLGVAWVISIYITNVTAKPGGIPRWVMWLGAAALIVALVALVAAL